MELPKICPGCAQPNGRERSYCWKCNRLLANPASTSDYLRLFNLKASWTRNELKTAFHRKAFQFHPDKNPGNKEAQAQFEYINEAYEDLSGLKGQSPELGHAGGERW